MNRDQIGLAKAQQLMSLAEDLSAKSHFNTDECKSLLVMYERMVASGKMDRLKFRDFLHVCFDMTDDIMLDLTFRAYDRNSDGIVDDNEFVVGLSRMIRGDAEEMTEFCYYVYDMNGDRSLAREELFHCLKGCLMPGYGMDEDELEDGEKDIVEMAMKKLDVNRDGQITYDDFQNAVKRDPLVIQAVGPCLPSPGALVAFLATVTEDYRSYSGCWGGSFDVLKRESTLTIHAPTRGRP